MLAGAWILVLLPLMDALNALGWTSSIPVPTVFDIRGAVRTLDQTLICWGSVYQPLAFCIGVVLLFSRERGRRRGRLDWTRRWGVICSYVVMLLSAVPVLLLGALVLVGIAAVFLSMPLKYQPGITQLFVEVSTVWLRYGPYPTNISGVVLVAFSSITMLLACVPLFDALRSGGRKWVAASLLAPLALFSLMHLGQAAGYCLGFSSMSLDAVSPPGVYFRPHLLVGYISGNSIYALWWGSSLSSIAFAVEATKWCIVVAIAVWLSIARLAAWRQGRKARGT